jgi:hypothetical protein
VTSKAQCLTKRASSQVYMIQVYFKVVQHSVGKRPFRFLKDLNLVLLLAGCLERSHASPLLSAWISILNRSLQPSTASEFPDDRLLEYEQLYGELMPTNQSEES